jgi:hypothetical protein
MVPTKRSAIALARGARTGDLMICMWLAVKTALKAAVNLASRSRMRNRNRCPASSRSMLRLRQLRQPRARWVRGDPEDVDPAPRVLDDEERVEPVQGDGVEVEQVAGENPVGLGSEELGP